ncbi:MAG: hypothetical protein M0T71_10675 [Actinomycetota bacterium]|nr:hypothetical protein [Actinomycetota bacterium]
MSGNDRAGTAGAGDAGQPAGQPADGPPGGLPAEAAAPAPVAAGLGAVPADGPGGVAAGDVDLLAAALRAERADLEVYERVLVGTLAEALPEGVVEVTRERSMADRLAGRPGRVQAIRARLGEHELELHEGRHGLVGTVARQVRGVAISRKEVGLDEWTRLLAEHLSAFAAHSAAARAALGRLLGAEGDAP